MSSMPPLDVYKRLLSSIRPYRGAFILAIMGNILYGIVDASLIKLLQPLMDEGFAAKKDAFIRLIPFIVLAIFVIRGLAAFMSSFFMGWVGRNIVMTFRQRLFDHYLRLPTSFFDQNTSGSLLSKITYDAEQVAAASTDAMTILVREGFTAVGLLIVMLSISWRLTLLFMLTMPLMAYMMHFSSRRMRYLSTQVQGSVGDVTHRAEEAIKGHREIKLFGGQATERSAFEAVTQNNRRQEMKGIVSSAVSVPLIQMVGAMALAATIYLATLNTGQNAQTGITAGAFAAMITAMMAILKPIKQMTKINSVIQRGIAGAGSIYQLLDEPAETNEGTHAPQRVSGEIVFENVSFAYPMYPDKMIIRDFSLKIPAGKVVAIVGSSGSGKTTLSSLLPRFYDVTSGQISLDGVDIQRFDRYNLRSHMSMVSQSVTLFNDTVRHNIAWGCVTPPSDEELRQACIAANALDFIEDLPLGFDTEVGDNGLRLSGGQRQRIAIARAIIKKTPILILDEATSALDTQAEREIQLALVPLMARCTTFVIAHRLSTIERADTIIVLNHGQIVEQGTHQELLARQGVYANLCHLQSSTGVIPVDLDVDSLVH